MSAKLTAEQARAIRFMSSVEGIVQSDPVTAQAIRDLIQTEFAYVGVSMAGYRALAEYDREHTEDADRARIASGMSQATHADPVPASTRTTGDEP